MKQSKIIINKQSLYVLPHELPNDLRLRIFFPTAFLPLAGWGAMPTQEKKAYDLRKLGEIRKISKLARIIN